MNAIEQGGLATPADIIGFWRDAGPDRWFAKDDAFDQLCRDRFLFTYEAAARGDLKSWELQPEGSLALVLLLDQFPRNMFRGTARVYATDQAALRVADQAIDKGHDLGIEPALRRFVYLPFMHSEQLHDQERSVALAEASGDQDSVKWAHHHAGIVRRFGRFPHRNEVLGRQTTPEEARFLEHSDFRG